MAVIGNPYAQYQNSKVLTASPAELTLMLYEGIIKFINIGILAIGEKDYEKANINIMKAERIVDHLNGTLNHKYPVAEDFDNIYNYLIRRLHMANVQKDKAILEEVNTHLRSVRDTWKEVMRKCRTGEVDNAEAKARA